MTFYRLIVDSEESFTELGEGNDWEGVVCPKHPGHQRAGRRITPLHLDIVRSTPTDFSRTMFGDIVISDNARAVMDSEGLTGFDVHPTVIVSSPSRFEYRSSPRLWELAVSGSAGNAHRRSGIVCREKCDACGLVTFSAFENGIIVDESTYDGSDFFSVTEYPRYILVSERAKEVLEGHRLSNVRFVDSSELHWPQGVIRP